MLATWRPAGPEVDACIAADLDRNEGASRTAFMREVLFAAATARTPMFADYPTSYHVDKRDLAVGIEAEAIRCGVQLRALLVVGPVGPLWSYHVVAFVEAGDTVAVSSLVMPHGRITGKSEARIAREDLDSFALALTTSPAVRSGLPTSSDSVSTGLEGEFAFDLLFSQYGSPAPVYWHARLFPRGMGAPSAGAQAALETVNAMLKRTKATYPPASAP